MEWQIQGVWKDENMPDINLLEGKFFGVRESEVLDLEKVSPNLRTLKSVWLDWEHTFLEGSTVEVFLSLNGGQDWTKVSKREVVQVTIPFKDVQLKTKQFIRIPYLDMSPIDSVRLTSVSIFLSSMEGDFEDLWNSFSTESRTAIPGSFVRVFLDYKDWDGRGRDLKDMRITVYNDKKNVLSERSF